MYFLRDGQELSIGNVNPFLPHNKFHRQGISLKAQLPRNGTQDYKDHTHNDKQISNSSKDY